MISTTLGGGTTQFSYNGDGVRLKQIVAGTPTTYTQDLAAPLPVVLQAKTGSNATQYLYSIGTRPIAQYTSAWEYLLPDALGSARQIADANGNVTLAKSYEPYGSVLNSIGSATSIFGYAGEQFDTTGLIYLRARYLQPTLGIFTSRDPWSGDDMQPGSMNGWNYVESNPVNATDPSGAITQWDSSEADAWREFLSDSYGIQIDRDYGERCLGGTFSADICWWTEGSWKSIDELKLIFKAVNYIAPNAMDINKYKAAFGSVKISRWPGSTFRSFSPPGVLASVLSDIVLTDFNYDGYYRTHDETYPIYGIIHEFGHVWDFKKGQQLSQGMESALGTQVCQTVYNDWLGEVCDCRFDINAGKEPPPGYPTDNYARTSAWEDWAEAFATYVYPDYYLSDPRNLPLGRLRRQYVEDQIRSIP